MLERLRSAPEVAVAAVAALLLVGLFIVLTGGGKENTVTAYFSRAVAIYPKSEVRILGVRVGEVTSVVPSGNSVRVEMKYDAQYKVPAEAKAVIVTPTLTADRFVQLTPAYTSGAALKDGAEIPVQDTGTPIELDRIYKSLSDLTDALGPNGVNKNGTLNKVLKSGSKFFDGQGRNMNTTIVNLSRAIKTFGDGSGDLFSTVSSLNDFTGALAANDDAVASFMQNLGSVSEQLGNEKDELYGALRNLAAVLGKVESFVRTNRSLLTSDVKDLSTVVKILADNKSALEDVLDVGPLALGNLVVAWDPVTSSIGSRITMQNNVLTADQILCALVKDGQLPLADAACTLFKTLLKPLKENAPRSTSSGTTATKSDGTREIRLGDGEGAGNLDELLGALP